MSPYNANKLRNRPRRQKIKWLLYLGIVAAFILIIGIPLYITSKPSFYARQKSLKPRYESWRASSHKTIACTSCHLKPGVVNAVTNRMDNIWTFYSNFIRNSKNEQTLNKANSQACLSCHSEINSIKSISRIPLIPHRIHTGSVTSKNDCIECHKWIVHDEKFQKRHKSLPLSGVCFKYGCHGEVEPIEECQSCHHRESIPRTTWQKQHPEVVNTGGANRCFDYCHKPEWCRNCHITGEKEPIPGTSETNIQINNTLISRHAGKEWLKFHGEEALGNSEKCLACHANYQLCENCHSIRPESHGRKETWLAQHKKPAERNERGCLTCHQKKTCDQCHELFEDVGR